MSTINKAAASMQTPADYTPRKEDFALLEQHDIATDKNFASQGYWKGVAIHFFRNKRAVTGLVIVLLIVFFAVFGPMMSRYGYKDIVSITTKVNGRNRQITAGGLAPRIPWLHKLLGGEAYEDQFADRTFIFGTDDMGRDLWDAHLARRARIAADRLHYHPDRHDRGHELRPGIGLFRRRDG